MSVIKIGIKALAKFMTAGSAAQRKVLRDYKYPNPEGQAQAKYYREARRAIAEFHAGGNAAAGLESQGAALLAGAQSAARKQVAARLRNNARAVKHYAQSFAGTQYEVLPDISLSLTFGAVQIAVNPDLHVREGRKEKLLKLSFAEQEPDPDLIKIISQGMFEAALAEGLVLPSSGVLYVDVPRGIRHKAARFGARMRADIGAACQNIAAIWPTV